MTQEVWKYNSPCRAWLVTCPLHYTLRCACILFSHPNDILVSWKRVDGYLSASAKTRQFATWWRPTLSRHTNFSMGKCNSTYLIGMFHVISQAPVFRLIISNLFLNYDRPCPPTPTWLNQVLPWLDQQLFPTPCYDKLGGLVIWICACYLFIF